MPRSGRGFKFVCANLLFVYADSRFAEPRIFLRKERFSCFSLVRKESKVHQRFANLWTPGTIQIAGRYVFEAKVTGIHQVTGYAENCSFPGIAGNDLNRCDAPALQHKIRANSKRTAVFFANSRLRVFGMGGGGWKRDALDGKKERFVQKKAFCLRKKAVFSPYAKPTNKEKTHFSTAKLQLPTAPKLTCSCKFHPRQLTVSLHYNNPFSKNISFASAVLLPFCTDSKPLRRRFADKTGFDTCRRKFLQNHFRQSFESSPESRGSQTSISLKHGRLAHVRSQFSLFRRSPTHKNLPPATFCASEHAF